MEDEKGLADVYYQKLVNENNKGLTMARFFGEIFDISYNTNHIKTFNRLIKLYGYRIVYFALLDSAGTELKDTEKIYGLISYFCKQRLESSNQVNRVIEKIKEYKKIKIPEVE